MTPDPFTLSDADLDALPGPIAVPAARYAKETDPRIKLLLMIDTIETIFKYGSAIVIQAMRSGDSWEDFIRSTRPKPLLQMLCQPQLSEHVGIIQAAYHFPRENPRSAHPSILKTVTPLSDPSLCNALKTLRNRRKGHGAWPSEEVAQASLTEFQHNFAHLVQLVKTLNLTYPLYLEASATQSATQFCGPTLREEVSDSSRLMLRENGVTILGLYPFFLAAGSGSVLYNGTEDWGEGAVTFLDYGSGADTDLFPGNTIAEDFKASYLGLRWEMGPPAFQGTLKEFTGRANDRRILDTFVLQDRTNLILIHGERGVGKTTLLEKWWQNSAPGPGGSSDSMRRIRHVIHEGSALADPREIAKGLLHQLDPDAEVEFDWSPTRFREEIQERLNNCSKRFPSLILIDGLDECTTKLVGVDGSLFDWIPAPSSTGLWIKWILGLRSHYRKSPEIKALEESCSPLTLEVSVFTPAEVTEYLRKSLDPRTVDQRSEVLPLVLERTRGLPLNLHLLVQAIREGDGKYSESFLQSFDADEAGILRKGIEQMTLESGRMEEYLERDEFEKREILFSRQRAEGIISLADYQSRCRELKTEYRSAGEQRFARLLAMFTLAKEPLTESAISSMLEMPEDRTLRYLHLASRFLKEEQDGYSFSHVAFRSYIADHCESVLDSLRTRISSWCCDPANRTHGYTIRNGVAHLIDDYGAAPSQEKAERLSSLLTDLNFISVKARAGLVPELIQDYEQALTCLTGSPSSIFNDLEVDDEDRSWILQNHLARKQGLPVLFPGRGGDLVIAAMQQRLAAKKAQDAAKDGVNKWKNISEGRDPEYSPGWDFDDKDDNEAASVENQPHLLEVPAEAAEKLAVALHEFESLKLTEAARMKNLTSNAFAQNTVTARAIAKMLKPSEAGETGTPAAKVEAFRCFVGEMWKEIADESFSVPDLCINYRDQGIVRQTGLTCADRKIVWLENLHPATMDIRKTALPFTAYGVDDGAEEVGFFDGFRKCLMVVPSRWRKGDEAYTFQAIDVSLNKTVFSVEMKLEGVGGSHLHSTRFRVCENGRFGRLDECYFAVDWDAGIIRQLQQAEVTEAIVVELLGSRSCSDDRWQKKIQISSADGLLFLETNMDYHLQLVGDWDRFGFSLTNYNMCGDTKFRDMRFSENGRFVFVGAADSIYVLDLFTWERIFQADHDSGDFCHTPDGRIIASNSNDMIRVWDVASKTLLRQFSLRGNNTSMHLSRSGELLFANGYICDLRTGGPPVVGVLESWAADFFGGDSKQFWMAKRSWKSEGVVHDSVHEGTSYSLNDALPLALEEGQTDLKIFLTDSEVIVAGTLETAVGSFAHGGVWRHSSLPELVCPITSDQSKRPKCDKPGLLAPTQSKDSGLILLPTGNGLLHVMVLYDGMIRMINHEDYLAAMDVTVGEQMIARYIETPWERERRESSERWALEKGEVFVAETKVPQFYINAAVISDDGQWVLTATNWDALRIWDITTGRCVRDFPLPPAETHFAGHVEAISLTPEGFGCYLALLDGSTYLLESWKRGACRWQLMMRLKGPHEVYCLAMQNRRFAVQQIHLKEFPEVYDLQSRTVISLAPLSRWFDIVMFSECNLLITPDDKHLLVARENTLIVFTLEGLQEITRCPLPGKVTGLSNMTPDGRLVVHTDAGNLLRLKLHLPEPTECKM